MKKYGKIEGNYWVWPNKTKTHLEYILIAISRYGRLPAGFYREAEKDTRMIMRMAVHKARELKLKELKPDGA